MSEANEEAEIKPLGKRPTVVEINPVIVLIAKLSNYLDLTVDFLFSTKYTQFQDGKLNKSQTLIKSGGGTRPCDARQPASLPACKGATSYRSIMDLKDKGKCQQWQILFYR